jgi:hypothetical protein
VEEAEQNILERLQIPIVTESGLHVGFKPVTVSLAVSDPAVASMWQTLWTCGAVATMDEAGRITFWRQLPTHICRKR